MKKIIITNNKKVEGKFAGKAEVRMMESASMLGILKEGREIAEKGGRLLQDPQSGVKTHYKSLVFYMEDGNAMPDEKSLMMLDRSIKAADKSASLPFSGKEPLLAGIFQNKDLDTVRKVLGQ